MADTLPQELTGYDPKDVVVGGGKVAVVGPDGRAAEVPVGELGQALGRGFRPETQREYAMRWAGQYPVQAAADAFGSGMTFGLGDLLKSDEGKKESALLREANPTASTVGEVASIFAGPGKIAAKAGELVGKEAGMGLSKLLGHSGAAALGGKLVGAATEGAVLSVGPTTSRVALAQEPLSLEAIAAEYAKGALGMGAAGSLTRAAQLAANSLLGKAGSLVSERIANVGTEAAAVSKNRGRFFGALGRAAMGDPFGAAQAFARGALFDSVKGRMREKLDQLAPGLIQRVAGAVDAAVTKTQQVVGSTSVRQSATMLLAKGLTPGHESEGSDNTMARVMDVVTMTPDQYRLRVHEALYPVAEIDPLAADRAEEVAMRRFAYLKQQIQAPPDTSSALGEYIMPRLSRSDEVRISRQWAASGDPDTLLHALKAGYVPQEIAEATKAVFPTTFELVRNRLLEAVANGARFSHAQRLGLQHLFDEPVDVLQQPDSLAYMAQLFQPPLPRGQGPRRSPPSGRHGGDIMARATKAQRVTER